MNYRVHRLLLVLAALTVAQMQSGWIAAQPAQVPVIPGAVGFGMNTPAGRGGTIYRVTSLADSGAGTLRAAVEASGPRILIFETSGNINLAKDLVIRNPFITIAGQTAPSPGIRITGASLAIQTHDVLIQHIRIRPGIGGTWNLDGRDAVTFLTSSASETKNIVLDHVSLAWSVDGLLDMFGEATPTRPINHVTIRNSIIAEALNCPPPPPGSGRNCLHNKGTPHAFASIIGQGAEHLTLWRNLFARNTLRNPYIPSEPNGGEVTGVAVVNNVVYKPGDGHNAKINLENFTSKAIEATVEGNVIITRNGAPNHTGIIVRGVGPVQLYLANNTVIVPDPPNVYRPNDPWETSAGGGVVRLDSPHTVANTKVSTRPASSWPAGLEHHVLQDNIESTVLASVGSRPADRDWDDNRIVNDVINRTGVDFIDVPPTNPAQTYAVNKVTHTLPADPHGDADTDGYTNIEEWLHAKAAEVEAAEGGPGPGPSAQVPVLDDFEDGDAAGWSAIGSWSVVADGASKAFKQSDLNGGRASLDASNWPDQMIEADVKAESFSGPDGWAGLFVRYNDVNNTYYITLRNSNSLSLRKIVNGAITILGTHAMPVSAGTTYRLRLEAVGSALKVYVNGTLVLTATDATLTGGRAAVGTSAAVALFDNILVTPTPLNGLGWAQDNFSDGDSAGWTQVGSSPWLVTSGALSQSDTAGGNRAIRAESYWRDQSIEADVKVTDAAASGSIWGGLFVRYTDESNTYYVTLRPGTAQLNLRKIVGGVITDLAMLPSFVVGMNTTYKMRFEAIGPELKVHIDGALVLQATDTALVAGRAAVGTSRASAHFDNIVVSARAPTLMSDNFEDGNANAWTPGGAHSWSVVTDGTLVYKQSDGSAGAFSTFAGSSPNQTIQARVKALSFNTPDNWVGLAARFSDISNHYYITARSPSNELHLRKTVGGVFGTLKSAPFTITTGLWYKFRLEVLDTPQGATELRVYVDTNDGTGWKLMIEHTDLTPLTAGNNFGIRMFGATAEYDDVVVTTP